MRSVVEPLCSFAGRGACTDAERRAAAWLHDELRSRVHEAWVETRWLRPQRWAAMALGCALTVAGGLLATTAPVAGVAAAAVGFASLAVEAAGYTGPLRALFPRRATQHVLTAPADSPVVLVLAAAYDTPRRGLLLNDRWRRWRLPRGSLAACAAVVVAAAGLRVAGVDEVWVGAVQLVPTIALLFGMAAAADVVLSAWSPGANDNASGVAVALAAFDELERRPPRALSPALLLVGAGHAGPAALRSHLRAERLGAERAVLLEIGPCGAGRPAWRARHPQVRAAAERAAAALGLDPGRHRPDTPPTRLPAIRIACLDERGLTPRAHQEDDTDVDAAAMEAALDLVLGVVDALDAELSARAPAASPRA